MKKEIEAIANEVRQIRKGSKRPKYSPELIAKVVNLLEKTDLGGLADNIGIRKETLRRWRRQSTNSPSPKVSNEQLIFSPIVPQSLTSEPKEKAVSSNQMIRVDFSYRDGRRMVLEIPASQTSCQDLLGSLRQEFFGGC